MFKDSAEHIDRESQEIALTGISECSMWQHCPSQVTNHQAPPPQKKCTLTLELRSKALAIQISCLWPTEKFSPFSITCASSFPSSFEI